MLLVLLMFVGYHYPAATGRRMQSPLVCPSFCSYYGSTAFLSHACLWAVVGAGCIEEADGSYHLLIGKTISGLYKLTLLRLGRFPRHGYGHAAALYCDICTL